jgi:autotransporter-associated beta strand protein
MRARQWFFSLGVSASVAPAVFIASNAAAQEDVVLAPGTYSGDRTHSGRTIIPGGIVTLNGSRLPNSPLVIVHEPATLRLRPLGTTNPVIPHVLELRGGKVVATVTAAEVNVLRLGSGTSEVELDLHPLTAYRMERNPGATMFLHPPGVLNPGTGAFFRVNEPPPGMFGTGGANGLPVAPWATAFATSSERAFVTHDGGGFRALNPATEFADNLASGGNVRLTAPATASSDVSINTLTLNGASVTLNGAALNVTGGGLLYNAGSPNGNAIQGTGTASLVLPQEGFVHTFGTPTGIPPVAPALTIAVPVSGGMLTKAGPGRLVLTRPNTYAGGTTLNEGTVQVHSPLSLGTGPIRFSGGTLVVEEPDAVVPNDLIVQAVAPLIPNRSLTLAPTGTTTLSGNISGEGLLTVAGNARFTGDGAPTGAYELRANAGAFTIDGNLASPASVVNGFTTYGNGIIRGVLSARQVSPGAEGNRVGDLTVGTAYFGGDNGRLHIDVAGTEAGEGHDQLIVLDALYLDRAFRGNSNIPTPALDVQFADDFVPSAGQQFTIVDNRFAGPLSATFKDLVEGSQVLAGDVPLRISYAGGDGNDVVLTVVPEPGAVSIMLLAAVPLLRRRRSYR